MSPAEVRPEPDAAARAGRPAPAAAVDAPERHPPVTRRYAVGFDILGLAAPLISPDLTNFTAGVLSAELIAPVEAHFSVVAEVHVMWLWGAALGLGGRLHPQGTLPFGPYLGVLGIGSLFGFGVELSAGYAFNLEGMYVAPTVAALMTASGAALVFGLPVGFSF